jgi:anti-sigma regulatory factor (Ser/Thr protein kinase)
MRASWVLPATARSAAQARGLVRELLGGLPLDTVEVVLLLTTELVTNAVRHGAGEVGVRLASSEEGVRVEVDDRAPESPAVQRPSLDAPSGRGMLLVDELADGWGVVSHDSGKTVWFRVDP